MTDDIQSPSSEDLDAAVLPGQVTPDVVPKTMQLNHMNGFALLNAKLRYERLSTLVGLTSGANEHWEYPTGEGEEAFPVLSRYINYTFRRVQDQHKMAYSANGEWAAFNTGLLTKFFDRIFGVFQKSKTPDRAPWFLLGFFVETDRTLSNFATLPERATYFDNPHDLVYDSRKRLVWDEHVLMDRSLRFPASLQGDDDESIHRRRKAVHEAVRLAKFRVEQSYRTAVPQFYWDGDVGRIQLLLPLCLEITNRPDLALAVYRDKEVYRAGTPLRLDWAYSNARLIAKPDSDWLNPS